MPCQCGDPDGMSPRGSMVFPRAPFIISNKPQFGKISMDSTMTAGRSSGAVEKSVCYNVKVTDDW